MEHSAEGGRKKLTSVPMCVVYDPNRLNDVLPDIVLKFAPDNTRSVEPVS